MSGQEISVIHTDRILSPATGREDLPTEEQAMKIARDLGLAGLHAFYLQLSEARTPVASLFVVEPDDPEKPVKVVFAGEQSGLEPQGDAEVLLLEAAAAKLAPVHPGAAHRELHVLPGVFNGSTSAAIEALGLERDADGVLRLPHERWVELTAA